MLSLFKPHASQVYRIMGEMGLSEAQKIKLDELSARKKLGVKPLTPTMEADLKKLLAPPSLPVMAQTYLREFYSGEREEIFSKFTTKGNLVENDLIDFMAGQIGLGMADKNSDPQMEDEYFIGSCDVDVAKLIVDVKSAWNRKTLQDNIEGPNTDYLWQGRTYLRLYNKPEFIVFHGLMNTPEELSWNDTEVIYDDMPDDQRWIAYRIKRDLEIEQQMIDRVLLCRKWLEEYDKKVQSRLGRIHDL